MDATTAAWLNRAGLLLDATSFVLAAPEIFGEGWLKKLEYGIERFLLFIGQPGALRSCFTLTLVLLTSPLLIMVYGVFFATNNEGCAGIIVVSGVVYLIYIRFVIVLAEKGSLFLKRLVQRLADDSQIRRRYLIAGAVCYFVGALFQLVATW